MAEKKIVTFKELPVLPYAMDYLRYCKDCSTYGLGTRPCSKCLRKENISLDEIAEKTVRKNLINRIGMQLITYVLLYLLCKDLTQLAAATVLSILLIACNLLIYRKYRKCMVDKELEKHIKANIDKIRQDLKKQMKAATSEVDQGDLKAAYERLRYLGKLMDNEDVRTFKLICLMNFQLRSDMPLEMNSLLQKDCNTYLIDYIYEVSKIRKDLIDEETILYILAFKEQVLAKSKGKLVMASVLEASLRSKYLLSKYAKYMLGYVEYFSKERLLRLCKLSSCIEDTVLKRELLLEVKEVTRGNEAFTEYFSKLEEI